MMNQDLLLALYRYNAYANRLVLETVAQLPEEALIRQSSPSHTSIQVLLLHMLGTELFFLKDCQGQPLPPQPTTMPTLTEIQGYFSEVAQEQENFIKSLAEEGLKREVNFQVAEQKFHLPVWQLLLQAFVHSTHHRGELSIVLSQLGYPLPTLDIIIPFVTQSGQEWPWK